MCNKTVITFPCGHQEEKLNPCKVCSSKGYSPSDCPAQFVREETSSKFCYQEGCRWEEFGGLWRCCQCLKAPNRVSVCRWTARTGNPCQHQFCGDCTSMNVGMHTSRRSRAGKKLGASRRRDESALDEQY
ncbi:hypothetical protein ESCO_006044 [Escovopsis weberi]|uniref:Uncharacterized protein n=1 Tax=Escovopsis weberi TaxID=150374 RepID=A0A0M9VRY9_ESCWE|nr:hypothetical protein ESCO_006044 [Escovopsis weberi]